MPKVLVSNNSELLRHLTTSPFRPLGLDLVVASSGDQALELVGTEEPPLVVLDAEMSGTSGYDAARLIKERDVSRKVVLVMGKRINAEQMRRVAECRCDEVLIAPMSADELYDVVAIQLGLSRRGSEEFGIELAVVENGAPRALEGRVTNLSVDGARLVLGETLAEDARMQVTVLPEGGSARPLELSGRVVWSQPSDDGCVVGCSFDELDEAARAQLARLVQWEVVEDTERLRVVIKGDITEATNFAELLTTIVGRVDFDLSRVSYMNSLGVRAWVQFLRDAPIQGYEFHACSVAFCLQASLSDAVLGRGTVTSFFAPYICDACDHEEQRLLQSAAILAAADRLPPTFTCVSCGGDLVLDDLPQRYLAFLFSDGA